MVDAADSKSAVRKNVRVQVPPRAPFCIHCDMRGIFKGFLLFVLLFSQPSCIKYEKKFQSTKEISMPIGEKIAFYANSFIGTPYDRIPIGLYVDTRRIIADNEVDCMYLVFRAVELAFAEGDNKKAIEIALDKRFHYRGLLDKKGLVVNYYDRFDYSEDMIASSKWGNSIFTKDEMSKIKGTRMYNVFYYLPKEKLFNNTEYFSRIKTGDIVFLVKKPELRSKAQEIIAHLGIVEVKNNEVYFIHASGIKGENKPQGKVKKVIFKDYLQEMSKFIGVYITRF